MWVAKAKDGNGSSTASISTSISARRIALNPGVGCAPSCWPIFGFRNLLGARRGRRGAVFCAVRVADFPAEGAGGEPPRGVAGELGSLDSECVAKILGFFRSLGKNKLFTHAAEANCFAQVRPGQAMRVHGC